MTKKVNEIEWKEAQSRYGKLRDLSRLLMVNFRLLQEAAGKNYNPALAEVQKRVLEIRAEMREVKKLLRY